MKRMFVLAALLALASACTPAEHGANNANHANANSATPQASPPVVSDADIINQDKQIWEALRAKNWDAFASHLADDAITVSGEGVSDKTQLLEAIKKLDLTDYTISDPKVIRVGPDAAVLTYTSTSKGKWDGQPLPARPSRDTTVFVRRSGKWLAVFHQETYADGPNQPTDGDGPNLNDNQRVTSGAAKSAAPAASPAATASPASSPSAAPASATDAEKQVWDFLKAKNWDGFANLLTSDSIEVEPDGVYTKAQSVEAVKKIDFTGVELSDFKEVKLDANSSVITYLVKGSGKDWPPKGMRHSTVWSNRGGRWQAHFHQGSIVTR